MTRSGLGSGKGLASTPVTTKADKIKAKSCMAGFDDWNRGRIYVLTEDAICRSDCVFDAKGGNG